MLSIKSVDVQSFKRAVRLFNFSSYLLFLWEIGDESGIYRFILLLIRYGDTTVVFCCKDAGVVTVNKEKVKEEKVENKKLTN